MKFQLLKLTQVHPEESKFTDDNNEIDENKYIFKKDNSIISNFENSDELLNGLFKIVSSFSYKYINNKNHFEIPDSLKQAKNDIVVSNDTIGNCLDRRITITKYQDDKLSAEELFNNS